MKLFLFCQVLILAVSLSFLPQLAASAFANGASERPAGLTDTFDVGASSRQDDAGSAHASGSSQASHATPPDKPAEGEPDREPSENEVSDTQAEPPAPNTPPSPFGAAEDRPPSVDTVGPAPAPVPNVDESKTAEAAASKAGDNSDGPQKILIFNTVAFRNSRALPDWESMLERNRQSPIFQAGIMFNKKTDWAKLQAMCKGKQGLDLLRVVNGFWNGFRYIEDSRNWGKPDYWACPAEFLRKSGDCEDYAIVKYFTLKELGISVNRMRIVVLKDTIRNLAHAVLVVFIGEEGFVLDNLSNAVLSHSRLSNYSPQFSVNENGSLRHVPAKKKK